MGFQDDKYELQSIHLNTVLKTYGSNSNPSWILDKPIRKVVGLKLKSLVLPLSVYNFDERNNKLLVTEGGAPQSISIPPGNYTSSTLPGVLKTILDAAMQAVFTVTYNDVTNKLTFSATDDFRFLPVSNDAYYELGISNEQQNGSLSDTLVADYQIDLSGLKSVVIKSNIAAIEIPGKPTHRILEVIPVTELNRTISEFQDDSQDYLTKYFMQVNEITLDLYDERMRPIQVNTDYELTINFLTE